MIGRAVDRILGATLWGAVESSRALAGKLGRVWASAYGVSREYESWQPYGFQARPRPGAEAMILSMGSHPGERVVLLVGDRRYTLALEAGEVAIADDLGQKVHLTREGGIVVDANLIKLGGSAALGVARETDPVAMSADFGTWAAAVTAALFSLTSGGFVTPTPAGTGTITSGSTVARSE